MGLGKYRAKRNFQRSAEPPGSGDVAESGASFVIQKHQASHLHYDFRLNDGKVLKSWAVPKGVPEIGEKRLAMMVEDHPIEYENFEGTIPSGNYGAGTVMVWDKGTYNITSKKAFSESLSNGELSFKLIGKKIEGEYSLIKLKKVEKNSWLMICRKGGSVKKIAADASVVSGKTMEEIATGVAVLSKKNKVAREEMPEFVEPMLAELVEKAFDDKDWLFEIKWDGYRIIARKNKKRCELFSRNRKNFTQLFIPITQSLEKMQGDFILDGEIVAIDENRKTSFPLLQNYLTKRIGILEYYVFDILHLNGMNLRELPLVERKKILEKIIPNNNVKISAFVMEKGTELFEKVSMSGGEGVIGKKLGSKYQAGIRSGDWVKIKAVHTQEVIVVGFTEPRGGRKKIGALLLAAYANGQLEYVGHAGSGFDDSALLAMSERLKPLIIEKCPLKNIPKTNSPATWVRPRTVVEVRFMEWTPDGLMRHPTFLGIREDKEAKEISKELPAAKSKNAGKIHQPNKNDKTEIIAGKKIELTNLDKVYWKEEGYTKGDLIEYYKEVSKIILPYLKDRPQSLNRFPDGIAGKSFFHKDFTNAPAWIETAKIISDSENKTINYLLCQDLASLVYIVNLGCIEINPWNCRINNLDKPDYMIFDIDPLDTPFNWAVEVAKETKNILDALKIKAYCKTSGSRGLHIFVPLMAKYEYDIVKEFCRLVNTIVNARLPTITSLERNPRKRSKKVYLDCLQNRKGQTMAAAYSVRPKKGAPVSAPLAWDEVNENLHPAAFNISSMKARIKEKGDLWNGVLKDGADLDRALKLISKMIQKKN